MATSTITTPEPTEYVVVLRPTPDSSDPGGTRRLRRLLKYGLRVCGLRCIRVVRAIDGETMTAPPAVATSAGF